MAASELESTPSPWRPFLWGRTISSWGDGLAAVAMTVIAFAYTKSVAPVAALWAVRGGAQVLLGPVVGHLADGMDRRLLLLAADGLGALALAGFCLAAARPLWAFLLLNGFLQGVEWVGDRVPTALIAAVAGAETGRARLNALFAEALAVGGMAAPLAAAVLMRRGAVLSALWVDVVTFALAAVTDAWMWRRVPSAFPFSGGAAERGRAPGVRMLWPLLVMALAAGVTGREMDVLGIAQARLVLPEFEHGSGLGVLETVLYGGAVAGAWVTARRALAARGPAVAGWYAVSSVALAVGLLFQNFGWSLLALGVAGASSAVAGVGWTTVLQRQVGSDRLGRVTGYVSAVTSLLGIAATAGMGALGTDASLRLTVLAATVCVLGLLAAGAAFA